MIVAQGGATTGYAIFVENGMIQVLFRKDGNVVSSHSGSASPGSQVVKVTLSSDGKMMARLQSGGGGGGGFGFFPAMPVDGLSVGRDEGGAVGPYKGPNTFTGTIESVIIELE